MGILNATPDSFSDGGSDLCRKIDSLLTSGAAIIDIGGESTRPGAETVSVEEECARILPLIKRIRSVSDIFISVDTRKSQVARAALEQGGDIINDVSCLRYDPAMAEVIAEFSAGLILNHSRGTPKTMDLPEFQEYPSGVAAEVVSELNLAAEKAISCGVKKESIIFDPGFGFAKNSEQNIELIRDSKLLKETGYPLLSGPSRKRFIGEITGESIPDRRDYGTCGAVIASCLSGYDMIRVHNVKAALDCLSVFYPCCPVDILN